MENQFFVDSGQLSSEALERKHRLETDPSFRKNHMEYLPGMEQIHSDVCENVMSQVKSYDYTRYTDADVAEALERRTCTVEGLNGKQGPAGDWKAFWQYGVHVYAAIYCELL